MQLATQYYVNINIYITYAAPDLAQASWHNSAKKTTSLSASLIRVRKAGKTFSERVARLICGISLCIDCAANKRTKNNRGRLVIYISLMTLLCLINSSSRVIITIMTTIIKIQISKQKPFATSSVNACCTIGKKVVSRVGSFESFISEETELISIRHVMRWI